MKKAIVTTTINSPTEAVIKFSAIASAANWRFFIVGDKKTPHNDFANIPAKYSANVVYLSPEWQETNFPKLSALIDWNCIQRRSLGFLAAYKWGAEIIATVDDDNVPLENWGTNLLVGQTRNIDTYTTKQKVFDPFSCTNYPEYWHRGFPIQLLPEKNFVARIPIKEKRRILVQADFWHGAPDIDAICRIAHNDPYCVFNFTRPFCSDKIAPFNSQNTFLHRSVMREYFMFPKVGRMDDIFAAYHLQHEFPNSVIFNEASVMQRRNPHNVLKDMQDEMDGYKFSEDMATDPTTFDLVIPQKSREAFREYQKEIDALDNS